MLRSTHDSIDRRELYNQGVCVVARGSVLVFDFYVPACSIVLFFDLQVPSTISFLASGSLWEGFRVLG